MNIAEIELDISYLEKDNKWDLVVKGPEINFKGCVGFDPLSEFVSLLVMPLIEKFGGEVGSVIHLVLDYHQDRIEEWYLDLKPEGSSVNRKTEETSEPGSKDLKATMSIENFLLLVGGMENASTMFMQQGLKISGNIALALKIQTVLEQQIVSLTAKL